MSVANSMLVPMADGHDVPQIFCTAFRLGSTEETKEYIHNMFSAGVRHFEIAELHGNGHTVCEALREAASREEIFITLKVWPKSRNPTDVLETVNYLLQTYELTYVDLLMMHAPIDVENKIEQFKALEEMKDSGVAKSIGIANLNAVLLQDLLKNCRVSPAVYETEAHPFGQNDDMTEFCSDSSIVVLNNEPVAKAMRAEHTQLAKLAEEHEMSSTRMLLLWAFSKGMCVGLSAATNKAVLVEVSGNGGVKACFNGPLSQKTMEILNSFEEGLACTWNPAEAVVDE